MIFCKALNLPATTPLCEVERVAFSALRGMAEDAGLRFDDGSVRLRDIAVENVTTSWARKRGRAYYIADGRTVRA